MAGTLDPEGGKRQAAALATEGGQRPAAVAEGVPLRATAQWPLPPKPHEPAGVANARITEGGDTRITESGEVRILE